MNADQVDIRRAEGDAVLQNTCSFVCQRMDAAFDDLTIVEYCLIGVFLLCGRPRATALWADLPERIRYLHADCEPGALGVLERSQTAPGVTAQDGEEVLDTPKWSRNAFAAYHFRVGADSVFPSVAADGFPEFVPNFTQRVASYSVFNLSLQLSHGAWQYELFANNLLDKRPIIDLNLTEPYNQAFTIRPLTVGLSVRTQL